MGEEGFCFVWESFPQLKLQPTSDICNLKWLHEEKERERRKRWRAVKGEAAKKRQTT
jgi:hypothetical protein